MKAAKFKRDNQNAIVRGDTFKTSHSRKTIKGGTNKLGMAYEDMQCSRL